MVFGPVGPKGPVAQPAVNTEPTTRPTPASKPRAQQPQPDVDGQPLAKTPVIPDSQHLTKTLSAGLKRSELKLPNQRSTLMAAVQRLLDNSTPEQKAAMAQAIACARPDAKTNIA